MRLRLLPIALLLFVFIILSAAPAEARHRDRDRGRRFDNRGRVVVVVPQRRGFHHRGFHRPHGWNQGRKVGWGHCDLPPGLAKKYGCHSSFRGRRAQRPVIVIPLPFVR